VPLLTRVAATSKSCSRWRGNLVLFAVESAFTLPWNSCSFCRGIPVYFGVEYSIESFPIESLLVESCDIESFDIESLDIVPLAWANAEPPLTNSDAANAAIAMRFISTP
jgi:hypothetical protein